LRVAIPAAPKVGAGARERCQAGTVSSGKDQSPRGKAEGEHFRALVEVTSDWLWEIDGSGRYSYASPKVKDLLGYEVSEVLGRSPFDFMPAGEVERVGAEFGQIVAERREFHELINTNLHKDGHEVILETSGVPIFDRQGTFAGFRGIDRDVTAREHDLRRLRLANAAMQSAAEGIVVADAQGAITAFNPAFALLSGYREAELLGQPPSMLSSEEDPRQRLWDLIGKAPKWSGEGLCRHRSGEAFSVWLTISAVRHGSEVTGYVALVSDMTERQLAEATIRFQATHDALTQLVNRTAWLAALKRALIDARSRESSVAVLFLDLDGFKRANDRYGHGVGDVLLSTTARRLERCVRRSDLVARFGGDEFTILLCGLTTKHAPQRVAKACVAAMKVPFRIDGNDVRISASVGVAVFPDHERQAEALVAAADRAMYEAKRAGGGRVHLLDAPSAKAKKPRPVKAAGGSARRSPSAPAARRAASRRRG
jgi:diguanylate cyclase (GGDEF)-like protein/PAS domain S-box-containing protein